jgi:hypothetical protein
MNLLDLGTCCFDIHPDKRRYSIQMQRSCVSILIHIKVLVLNRSRLGFAVSTWHLLGTGVVLHNNLLDLEHRIRSRRPCRPLFIAVPDKTVSIHITHHRLSGNDNSRPIVPKPMPVRRSRHILRQLELKLAVHVESAGAAVPVDAVVVDARESIRGWRAGFVRAFRLL